MLVALSGGPDSTALLDLLLERASELRLRVLAAHFDHGARPGSAREAERVARRARGWGVPVRVGRPDAPLEPAQAAFRAARYAFLERAADEEGADRIATGHQADDQAETVLHRILRGTGLRGLAGIPSRRGRLVRPLLPFRREEILAYLEERGLPYLRDPSNRDPRWTRTRIRHAAIPALERAMGADVRARLAALAGRARRADRALDAAARRAMEEAGATWERDSGEPAPARVRMSLPALRRLDPSLRARIVRLAARRLGVRPRRGGTRVAVEFIKRGRSGGGVDLVENVRLWREFDALWIGRPPRFEPDGTLEVPDASRGSGRVCLGGRPYRAYWGPGRADRTSGWTIGEWAGGDEGRRWTVALPLDRLEFPLRLRGPRPGDRLRLARGTRKLKRLFNERRIPRSERPRTPVVAQADRVLWVGGIGPEESGGRRSRAAGGRPAGGEERFLIGISDA